MFHKTPLFSYLDQRLNEDNIIKEPVKLLKVQLNSCCKKLIMVNNGEPQLALKLSIIRDSEPIFSSESGRTG